MISPHDIERLAKVKSDHGILSAYIPMDPRLRFVRQQAATQFKGAVKASERRIQESRWQHALDREKVHVLNFLSNSEPAGRGLVIFSCRPEGFWEVLTVDVPLRNLVDVDNTTKTGLLTETLNEFPRFIVAVLQRDKARIYTAQHGVAKQQSEVSSEVPGQHRQGGSAQMRFERHIEFHVEEHLKKVADELKRLAQAGPFKLAFGGTEETVDEILKMLPEPLVRAFIGRFPVSHKHDTEQQVLDRAQLLWNNRQQFEESKLIDQIFDATKSNTRGVWGLNPL